MAKLKADGRTELARFVQETANEGRETVITTRAYMSDGKVLSKYSIRRLDGTRLVYGWSVAGKTKPGVTVERIRSLMQLRGWTEVRQPKNAGA